MVIIHPWQIIMNEDGLHEAQAVKIHWKLTKIKMTTLLLMGVTLHTNPSIIQNAEKITLKHSKRIEYFIQGCERQLILLPLLFSSIQFSWNSSNVLCNNPSSFTFILLLKWVPFMNPNLGIESIQKFCLWWIGITLYNFAFYIKSRVNLSIFFNKNHKNARFGIKKSNWLYVVH